MGCGCRCWLVWWRVNAENAEEGKEFDFTPCPCPQISRDDLEREEDREHDKAFSEKEMGLSGIRKAWASFEFLPGSKDP
jgi:hypothetical protein